MLLNRTVVIVLLILSAVVAETLASAQPYMGGDIFVTSGGSVARIAASDSMQSRLTPELFIDLQGIDVSSTGSIFVTQWNNGNFPGALYRLDPGAGSLVMIKTSELLISPSDVDILPNGNVLVCDPAALGGVGALFEVDPGSGAQTTRLRGDGASRNPGNAARDLASVVYFISATPDSGVVIFRLAPNDTVATRLTSGGYLIAQSFLAWHAGKLFATSYVGGQGMVVEIDPQSGDQSIVSMGGELEGPQGIGVHPSGCIVVLDFPFDCPPCCCRRKLLCIDPQTGEQGVIAQYGYLELGGVAVFPGITPAARTTWGSVKARYRN